MAKHVNYLRQSFKSPSHTNKKYGRLWNGTHD
jgi:hypothetical protein